MKGSLLAAAVIDLFDFGNVNGWNSGRSKTELKNVMEAGVGWPLHVFQTVHILGSPGRVMAGKLLQSMALKRQPNPYPSPVSTPGLSSPSDHPTDACRTVGTGNHEGTTAVPSIDYLESVDTGYREVLDLLTPTSVNSPSTVRSKLTSLTLEQCHQLSSDVRDELARRTNEEGVSVLPDREGFAPQRNETRRKLATLPKAQFQNLFGDVHLELGRRCPGPKEDLSVVGLAANGDGLSSSNSSTGKRNSGDCQTTGSASCDQPSDSAYARPYRPSESKNQPKQTGLGIARTVRAKVSFRGPVIEDSDSELDNHSSLEDALGPSALLFSVKEIEENATQTTDFPSVAPWAIANPKDLTGMIVLERMYPSVGGGYADIYAGTLWKRGVKRKFLSEGGCQEDSRTYLQCYGSMEDH
ncbi:hypothetical protein GALMADRAFT_205932 [Galerina marginata CBS 339.88]|uniref:GIT Spa2 homology (SHD) domain-containing protein n=1 Tax=Galerina marginata (strain CBS 339.88) TaxID=685588 RepID=A0A067TLW3_GALM3|nr:hypothetical protein GALMADRAFT_205932 [Galerina marginata CBS 339.88]